MKTQKRVAQKKNTKETLNFTLKVLTEKEVNYTHKLIKFPINKIQIEYKKSISDLDTFV